jgi:quinohemoprotein ethanol dehydrogenase
MNALRLLVLALTLSLSLAAFANGPAAVDQSRLSAADSEPGQWMSTGRTWDEQRFSPLKSINTTNVSQLALAAYFDIPTRMGQEATPIVVDGVMYIATDWSVVKAIDAQTGKQLWSFDPKVRAALVKGCCGGVNRGVAVWNGKVFVGALDGRLIALDAASGKPVWQTVTVDQKKPYTITGAPRIVKGHVLIGNGGAEMGVRGYVSAYDAESGKMLWRFYTVPGKPGQKDHAASDRVLHDRASSTWFGDFWKYGGGGTVWDSMSYDPKLDLLYIGTGNGSPWNQRIRSKGHGDNLFLSSIVALRPDTGEYVWHYQTTPGESWDFTATSQMILADLKIDGRERKVLMQSPKNGYFYVLDRASGELLSAKPIVPMTWSTGVDMKTGRPIENPDARFYNTGKPFLIAPSGLGAHSWQPMSYSPLTGLVYIPVQQLPVTYVDGDPHFGPQKFNLGVEFAFVPVPPELAVGGWLAAWDPVAVREVWRVPHPVPANGGTLSTAGGLVFQGDAQGTFSAYAADNGNKLWSFDAQTGIVAGPMSYTVGSEQYVAIMAGWGGNLPMLGGGKSGPAGNNRLLIFKLGGTAALPAKVEETSASLTLPTQAPESTQVKAGSADYASYCSRCHGFNAISGGNTPDLRHSPMLTGDAWFSVVMHGALADRGMAGFAPVLDRNRVDAIRAYVISESQKEAAEMAKAPAR